MMAKQNLFQQELKAIKDSMLEKVANIQPSDGNVNPFDEMIKNLNEEQVHNPKLFFGSKTANGLDSTNPNAKPSCGNNCNCNCTEQFARIDQILKTLSAELEILKLTQGEGNDLLKIGGFTFSSRDNLLL